MQMHKLPGRSYNSLEYVNNSERITNNFLSSGIKFFSTVS